MSTASSTEYHIYRRAAGGFLVDKVGTDAVYKVKLGREPRCTCPAFEHRGGCKHIKLVRREVYR